MKIESYHCLSQTFHLICRKAGYLCNLTETQHLQGLEFAGCRRLFLLQPNLGLLCLCLGFLCFCLGFLCLGLGLLWSQPEGCLAFMGA